MPNEKDRYTRIEFPGYRFIPGQNPHPTEDPQGHSFGKLEAKITTFDPGLWRANEQYLFGVDLYNHGYWWESHEAFEGLWRAATLDTMARNYLQGLIKISAAFLKWHAHQRSGLQHLYKGGMEHLSRVRGQQRFMGVTLPEHIDKLESHFAKVINSDEWPNPFENYPFIVLEK